MPISRSSSLFFAIILLTGALTSFSDLEKKKIYNNHLIICAILGILATIYTNIWIHEAILFHIINGLIGFVTGSLLHRSSLWRGGDAKLFTLYAFLMPALQAGQTLFSSTINLFACSFIAGAMTLIPFFIKDIASNHNTIITQLFSPQECKVMLNAVQTTVFYSWIFFPVYFLARLIHFPALSLIITYIIMYIVRRYFKKIPGIKGYFFLGTGIALGFFIHWRLYPLSLSWPIFPLSLLKITLYASLSACIYSTLELLRESHQRVAFAPLLFTGCILCYTPFLTWIMYLTRR